MEVTEINVYLVRSIKYAGFTKLQGLIEHVKRFVYLFSSKRYFTVS